MARAVGLGSMFRGKLGSYVGYLTKNRAGRYVQSVKAYQPVVSNPQSYAQALARVPLGPTQRFYNALSGLISRGFEGTAYGEPSKAEFLSYNLSYFAGPYLTKGDLRPWPGPFLIAKGSLSAIKVLQFDTGDDYAEIIFNTGCGPLPQGNTIGAISQSLISWNPNLSYGEQLTFVYATNRDGQVNYYYRSFILDPTDTTYATWWNSKVIGGNYYLVFLAEFALDADEVIAAACIRSAAYGETGFLRSTTYMQLNPNVPQYNTEEDLRAAVLSYRDANASDDDWETDPTPIYQQIANLVMVEITESMVYFSSYALLRGTKCLGYMTKSGEVGIFFAYNQGISHNQLLDGYGKFLYVNSGQTMEAVRYNNTYQPAVPYLDAYGTILR